LAEQLTEAHESAAAITADHEFVPQSSRYPVVKVLLDRVLGTILLLLSLPLIGILAVAVRIDSGGPAIFRQRRVGRTGQLFTIYKLRSMTADAPAYSYKVHIGDKSITRVGRWLRRTGLDELPQLWNVVKGDMSLIGPRPELPFIVDQYENGEHRRLSVRPGITGWWQIHHRNEVPMHLNLEYDFYYLDNLSFQLDFLIARRTMKVMIAGARGKRARARLTDGEKQASFS
jgi:lipopolysaccharide/colanic/teichoic acid biosynthesis glycosyltransferase